MAKRKSFLLRLNPEVHAALVKWADDEFRSLNGHLEYLLRQGHGLETIRPAKAAEWPNVSEPVEIDLQRLSKSDLPD